VLQSLAVVVEQAVDTVRTVQHQVAVVLHQLTAQQTPVVVAVEETSPQPTTPTVGQVLSSSPTQPHSTHSALSVQV
jgi:hypothetical protein